MEVKNYYPELPVVDYKKTTIAMVSVINYIKALFVSREVKMAMYIMFRNESANGLKGVNNNYSGIQADGNRWPDELTKTMAGTVVLKENGTQRLRRFVAFKSFEGSLDFLADRVKKRGLYVGGKSTKITTMQIDNPTEWCQAYYKSWVTGNAAAIVPPQLQKNLLSIYDQAEEIFKNC